MSYQHHAIVGKTAQPDHRRDLYMTKTVIRGQAGDAGLGGAGVRAAAPSERVRKVVQSAIANARVKAERDGEAFDERLLVVRTAYVDEGPTMKRFRPRAQGRAYRINKRTSHITVVVAPRETKSSTAAAESTAASKKGRTR